MIELRSPADESTRIRIPTDAARLAKAFNGTVAGSAGDEYPIRNHIIGMLGEQAPKASLAQATNHLGITASAYEDLWRVRSIGLLSGQDFSLDEERARLKEWLPLQPGQVVLDLGCSTAVYARTLAQAQPEARVVAVDFSLAMLNQARTKARAEGTDLYLLHADCEKLPFFPASVDAAACGGTLNEFRDPARVLYETRRVLKSGAPLFMMYLTKAETWAGRLAQAATRVGGVDFRPRSEWEALFERAGFRIEKRAESGIVAFALLRAE